MTDQEVLSQCSCRPPLRLQTATFVIPWIIYGRFCFGKLTLSAERLRAVRETSTQWAVCWLSDMVDLVPVSLPVLHITWFHSAIRCLLRVVPLQFLLASGLVCIASVKCACCKGARMHRKDGVRGHNAQRRLGKV